MILDCHNSIAILFQHPNKSSLCREQATLVQKHLTRLKQWHTSLSRVHSQCVCLSDRTGYTVDVVCEAAAAAARCKGTSTLFSFSCTPEVKTQERLGKFQCVTGKRERKMRSDDSSGIEKFLNGYAVYYRLLGDERGGRVVPIGGGRRQMLSAFALQNVKHQTE